MDLFGILGTALRRWHVSVPIVIVGLIFSYQAYQAVVPAYSGTSTIVVLPNESPDTDEDGPSNPYGGSSGTEFAASVLGRNIDSAAFQQRLGVTSGSDRAVSADVSQDQPMIRIEAVAPNEGAVLTLLDDVVAESERTLLELQEAAGAVPETIYRTERVVPVGEIEDVTPSRFRMAGAIFALSALAAVMISVLVDSILGRDRRRRDPDDPLDEQPTVADQTDDDKPASDTPDRAPAASTAQARRRRRTIFGRWPTTPPGRRRASNGRSGEGAAVPDSAVSDSRDGQRADDTYVGDGLPEEELTDGGLADGELADRELADRESADGELVAEPVDSERG